MSGAKSQAACLEDENTRPNCRNASVVCRYTRTVRKTVSSWTVSFFSPSTSKIEFYIGNFPVDSLICVILCNHIHESKRVHQFLH